MLMREKERIRRAMDDVMESHERFMHHQITCTEQEVELRKQRHERKIEQLRRGREKNAAKIDRILKAFGMYVFDL